MSCTIFWSISSEKMGQKTTGAKKSKASKITLFRPVELTNEFLKIVLYFQAFLQSFYHIAIRHLRLQKKIIWPYQFYFWHELPKNHFQNSIFKNIEYPNVHCTVLFFKHCIKMKCTFFVVVVPSVCSLWMTHNFTFKCKRTLEIFRAH